MLCRSSNGARVIFEVSNQMDLMVLMSKNLKIHRVEMPGIHGFFSLGFVLSIGGDTVQSGGTIGWRGCCDLGRGYMLVGWMKVKATKEGQGAHLSFMKFGGLSL